MEIFMWIFQKYRKAKRWYKNIYRHHDKVDLGQKRRVPFFVKIKYNLLGFTDADYVRFDLKNNDYRNYISYKERLRLENVNGRFAFFLGEKVMFERMFGKYINVPHIFCWVKNGKLTGLEGEEHEVDLVSVIREQRKLIAKPTRSVGGGTGVHRISCDDDGKLYFDDKEYGDAEWIEQMHGLEEYIIVQNVSSAEYSKKIFPDSVNTIRLVTVMDRASDCVRVLFAYHRFGTSRTAPVDNVSSGGLFALIDEDTGVIGKARSLLEPGVQFSLHPDMHGSGSGSCGGVIEGAVIPGWNNIVDSLKRAHRCFPYYEFFAWDVAIAEDGKPYILEINRGSDLNIQIIKPMRNEKLGHYMREKGLLDNF